MMSVLNWCFVILLTSAIANFCLAWGPPEIYDDSFGSYSNLNPFQIETPVAYTADSPQIYSSNCVCISLKSCPLIFDIVNRGRSSISNKMIGELRKTHCGFRNKEPLVCCPLEQQPRRGFTNEDRWVWDNNKQRFIERDEQFLNIPLENHFDSSRQRQNSYNNFHEIDDNFNLVDFEDPKTFKNCPPSFYDEFDIPPQYRQKFEKSSKKTTPHRFSPKGRTRTNTETRTVLRSNSQTSPFLNRGNIKNLKRRLLNTEHCGVSVNTRIVGGKDAGPGQFPWMARLAYRNTSSGKLTYRCAGSVISEKYVLTAAHCVTNLIEVLEVYLVRLGELDIIRDLDCSVDPIRCAVPQDYEIAKITSHPNYDQPKYANDIALIRLVRPFNASEITPICLPLGELSITDQNLTGQTGIIAGWGSKTSGNQNPTLQWVKLPIVNQTECAASYARFSANSRIPIIVSRSQLCVQGMERRDACQGDSGGPLMSEGLETNLRYTLLGLVSFGPRTCGVSNFPGVYTRVSAYMDWIIDNMEM